MTAARVMPDEIIADRKRRKLSREKYAALLGFKTSRLWSLEAGKKETTAAENEALLALFNDGPVAQHHTDKFWDDAAAKAEEEKLPWEGLEPPLGGTTPHEEPALGQPVYLLTEEELEDEEGEFQVTPGSGLPTKFEFTIPGYHVTNSELRTFKRCRRKWWLAYYRELKLQTQERTGPRALGTRVHLAMSAKYSTRHEDPMQVLELTIEEDRQALESIGNVEGIVDLEKEAGYARAMMQGYIEWVAETGVDEHIEVVGNETVVEAPFLTAAQSDWEPIILIGKMDLRVRRTIDGARMFMDHKALPLTEPVLTPTGWVKMGELHVGDVVTTQDGGIARVTHVFDRGADDVYRIVLNDDTVLRGTADHPWWARPYHNAPMRKIQTFDLRAGSRIEHMVPIEQPDVALPIDPYTLGMWIANGGRSTGGICDGVPETLRRIHDDVKMDQRPERKPIYNIRVPGLFRELDELNLGDKHSRDRFIPSMYIHAASPRQRMGLLHGLMDGDGDLSVNFSSHYVTTSPRLAADVSELVQSLGGWARWWTCEKPSHVGTKAGGYDTLTHTSIVTIRSDFNPFSEINHAKRWAEHRELVRGKRGTSSTDKIVRSVEHDGYEDVRCIAIDSAEHLFVTRGYAVSHNTVGSLTEPLKTLALDEQMLHYHLLEYLEYQRAAAEEGGTPEYSHGGLYNMLRKSKRTATARPPFYDRIEVRHNPQELNSYWARVIGEIADIVRLRKQLDAGADHRQVAYPMPTRDCSWDCDFLAVCPMLDDGSAAEEMLEAVYVKGDPHGHYAPYGERDSESNQA